MSPEDKNNYIDTSSNMPKDWGYLHNDITVEQKSKINWGLYILMMAGTLLLLSLAYTGYSFYYKANQLDETKIILNINAPDTVEPGKEFYIKLSTTNNNRIKVTDAHLDLEYKKSLSGDGISNVVKTSYTYGELPRSLVKMENIENIKLYGRSDDIIKFKASLHYKIEGNNAIFIKEYEKDIKLLPRQISVSIEGPKDIDAGEAFTYKVIVKNDSDRDIDMAKVSFAFPAEYNPISSSVELSSNNEWDISSFKKGQELSNTIVATQGGINGEEKVVRVKLEEMVDNVPAIINDANYVYNIIYLPLTLVSKLKINHNNTSYIYQGQTGTLALSWENSLNEAISNMYFRIDYNGTTTQIDKQNYPNLSEIVARDKSMIEIPLIAQGDKDGNMHITVTAYGDRLQSTVTNTKLGSTDILIKVRNSNN